MLLAVLRFNFASPEGEPHLQSGLLTAALELAQWGESRGITMVSVDEHHVTGHGWSCNPIMAAAMLLARTETLIASVDCALGPLWNPVRLAEDIALVDNMSRGRLHTTVGLGYRTIEYDSLGVDFKRSSSRSCIMRGNHTFTSLRSHRFCRGSRWRLSSYQVREISWCRPRTTKSLSLAFRTRTTSSLPGQVIFLTSKSRLPSRP